MALYTSSVARMIEEFEKLPGWTQVGSKACFYLLGQSKESYMFANAILEARNQLSTVVSA